MALAWQPSTDTNVVGYNVYFGGASETYTNIISAGNAMSAVVSNLVQGGTYYFAVTAYDTTGLESPFSSETSYEVPLNAVGSPGAASDQPTLNVIGNLSINENAGVQTVDLSGISPGAIIGKQKLKITATTSEGSLIPKPKIHYTSANPTGTLIFTPKKNATGTATITVTVNNGEKTDNLAAQTFTVTVIDLNQPPTLNPISSLFLTENAGEQTVDLSGITSGIVTGKQKLKITAASSDDALIPTPKVKYISANPTGTLTFTPKKNAIGTATITVTANNGEKTKNLVSQTFTVTVLAPSSTASVAAIKASDQTTSSDIMSQSEPASPTLTPLAHANGQFVLTVSGSSDQECIIQASTNLVDWIPVWTNTPPFTYTDINAGQFSQRFYRSVPVPAP
ncbi:MAG TPA: Ig-like domain-containing protein [Verrucomicrobiae bacterium]|nr:Ig-like domain-containing protein [Verrucomicrobiae bacterium]